ncbi:MAG: hypothetical protein IKD27_03355, partial [Oscillospiraceae bacterium]|nr:hypothetical protein [Oscillospiraceae bacterium]
DFPKGNHCFFALRRLILPEQNQRATNGRPYGYFFDKLGCSPEIGGASFLPVQYQKNPTAFGLGMTS